MKKNIFYNPIPTILVLLISLVMPFCAFAKDNDIPVITNIEFSNASLDEKLSEEQHEYTITLDNPNYSPVITLLEHTGDAEYETAYLTTGGANRQYALSVYFYYGDKPAGNYTFNYSNPPEYILDDNSYLSDIEYSDGQLSPEFNKDVYEYNLYIPNDLEAIRISATPDSSNATCNSYEEITLSEDDTQIYFECVSSSGNDKSKYIINIKRTDMDSERFDENKEKGVDSIANIDKRDKNTTVVFVLASIAVGLVIIYFLIKYAKRISVNPYDKDEKDFYKSE